jgi:hypothetical protein
MIVIVVIQPKSITNNSLFHAFLVAYAHKFQKSTITTGDFTMHSFNQYYQQSIPVAPATKPIPLNAASTPPTAPFAAPAAKPVSPIVQRLHAGFMSVSATSGQIGKRFITHPSEIRTNIERARESHTQYGNMISAAEWLCEHNEQLQSAVSEAQKSAEWYSGQCVPVANLGGEMQTFNSFHALVASQSR